MKDEWLLKHPNHSFLDNDRPSRLKVEVVDTEVRSTTVRIVADVMVEKNVATADRVQVNALAARGVNVVV